MFFAVVLAKKYTNPSSDIIEVLAGLDDVDAVFNTLVETLDHAITDGRTGKTSFLMSHRCHTDCFDAVEIRQRAVRAAIAVVSGGYQTALVSYFLHRDFFPALMKVGFTSTP